MSETDQCPSIFRGDNWPVQCSVLEQVLLQHPMVLDCGAFAKPCDRTGEVPAAWVVLNPKAEANEVAHLVTSLKLGPIRVALRHILDALMGQSSGVE